MERKHNNKRKAVAYKKEDSRSRRNKKQRMVKDKQKGTKLIMRGQHKERTAKGGTKNKRQTKE